MRNDTDDDTDDDADKLGLDETNDAEGLVTDSRSRTLKWAIIMSRIMALPLALEVLIVGWGVAYAALEGPRAFTGWGVLILIFIVIASLHGAPAAGCVLIGWRMTRRRANDVVPRASATWGAIFGFVFFLAPAIPLCFDFNEDALTFFAFTLLGTWPALVFAILCVKLRRQAPPRSLDQPADNA